MTYKNVHELKEYLLRGELEIAAQYKRDEADGKDAIALHYAGLAGHYRSFLKQTIAPKADYCYAGKRRSPVERVGGGQSRAGSYY